MYTGTALKIDGPVAAFCCSAACSAALSLA